MKTYPYAIFDMDGTLLDSMKVWKNLGGIICSLWESDRRRT
mgnify:CR=1 FL=1